MYKVTQSCAQSVIGADRLMLVGRSLLASRLSGDLFQLLVDSASGNVFDPHRNVKTRLLL